MFDNQNDEEENSNFHLPKMKFSKDELKTIGSLFKKRFTTISKTVVTNRIWLKSAKSSSCHVLLTFPKNTSYDTIFTIMDRILKAGLIVNVKQHKTSSTVGFYITASYERLLQGAEDLEIKKIIKTNYGGGIKEFIFDEQEFYENIENEDLFLTTQERQSIIYDILYQIRCDNNDEQIIVNDKKVPNGRRLIFWCQKYKIISQILPIHDQDDLKELRKNWVFSLFSNQPLDKVCKYFGIKLTLYFAWLGFYTKSLLIPAFLGLAMWLSMGKDEKWDSIFFLVLCSFNLIWSICFNDLWNQRCAELSYKWGTLDMKENLLQDPRPMFKGEYKLNKVNNKLEPHYPEYKRALFRYLITFPTLLAVTGLTIAIMLKMFDLQEFFNHATTNKLLPELMGLTNFIPKMIYANIISFLNSVYKRMCTWLNDKENYREQTTHENHLIVKIVLFQFINSYLSLFYIAFYLQDVGLLKEQLFAIFITRQLTGNIKEAIFPYIFENLKQIKKIDRVAKDEKLDIKPDQELIDNVQRLQRYATKFLEQSSNLNTEKADNYQEEEIPSELSQPEVESLMPNYPDTFGDYLEMVMQYGLMVFFAPAFPLAALFTLFNNFIEIRTDAFKMCFLYQRPFGQIVSNIGRWQDVIETFSILGIIVNCGLLITFGVIQKLLPSVTFYESVAIVIVVEHVFLGFYKVLNYSLPKLPRWIIVAKSRLEYRRREALRTLEMNEMHNIKCSSNN
ncbi:unnamed protein product [Brachionus calyciflorus]|uniref:Anoctamin n=1 Tax=Brachionus calyciflorus TaxID=104777 RepID=A0A813UTG7_9BILA|nr:unnamed protein product [Brachionus calyciflorus]